MFRQTYNYINSFFSGDTDLHSLLRIATTAQEIEDFLASKTNDEIQMMLHSVNQYGRLPLELIPHSKLSQTDKIRVESQLLNLALQCNGLPLNKHMTEENIISAETSKDSESIMLLEAANAARDIIKYSPTHADANQYDMEELFKLAEKNKSLKDKILLECDEFLTTNRHELTRKCKKQGGDSIQKRRQALNQEMQKFLYPKFAKNAKQTKMGTCEDFAILMHEYLKERNFKAPIKIIRNKKNDHILLVVLKNAAADPCDINNWDKIADGFNGDIITDKNKFRELKLFRRYQSLSGKSYNLTVNFDPNYHTFEEAFALRSINEPQNSTSFYKKVGSLACLGLLAYTAYKLNETFTQDDITSQLKI